MSRALARMIAIALPALVAGAPGVAAAQGAAAADSPAVAGSYHTQVDLGFHASWISEELVRMYLESAGPEVLERWRRPIDEAVAMLLRWMQGDALDDAGLAVEALVSGNVAPAIALFERASTAGVLPASESAAALRHGGALAYLVDEDLALRLLAAAHERAPGSLAASIDYTTLLASVGEIDRAEAVVRGLHRGATGDALPRSALVGLYAVVGADAIEHGEVQAARRLYAAALDLERAGSRSRGNGELQAAAGLAAWRDDDLPAAERHLARAARLLSAPGRAARAHANLAMVRERGADLSGADAAYRRALELAERAGDPLYGAAVLSNKALLLERAGDLEGARGALEEALVLASSVGDEATLAALFGNLGLVILELGDLPGARDHLERALDMESSLERETGMANAHANLARVHRLAGDRDRARSSFEQAIALDKRLGRRESLATHYVAMGDLEIDFGGAARALDWYRRALDVEQSLARPDREAMLHSKVGHVLLRLGYPEEAEQAYRSALALETTLARPAAMAADYGNLAAVYWRRGDADTAESMYRRALELFEQAGDRAQAAKTRSLLRLLREGRDPFEPGP